MNRYMPVTHTTTHSYEMHIVWPMVHLIRELFQARHEIKLLSGKESRFSKALTLAWHFFSLRFKEHRERLCKRTFLLLLYARTMLWNRINWWINVFLWAESHCLISHSPTWFVQKINWSCFAQEQNFETIQQWKWSYQHLLFSQNLNGLCAGLSPKFYSAQLMKDCDFC